MFLQSQGNRVPSCRKWGIKKIIFEVWRLENIPEFIFNSKIIIKAGPQLSSSRNYIWQHLKFLKIPLSSSKNSFVQVLFKFRVQKLTEKCSTDFLILDYQILEFKTSKFIQFYFITFFRVNKFERIFVSDDNNVKTVIN